MEPGRTQRWPGASSSYCCLPLLPPAEFVHKGKEDYKKRVDGMRGASSVNHRQGESMGKSGTRRATLALGACAGAALLAFSAPSQAQPVGYTCEPTHKYLPGKADKPQFDTTGTLKSHELWLDAFASPNRTDAPDATMLAGLRLAKDECDKLVTGKNGKRNIRAEACLGDALFSLA